MRSFKLDGVNVNDLVGKSCVGADAETAFCTGGEEGIIDTDVIGGLKTAIAKSFKEDGIRARLVLMLGVLDADWLTTGPMTPQD